MPEAGGADMVALSFGVVPSILAVARRPHDLRDDAAATLFAAMKTDTLVLATCRDIVHFAFLSTEPSDIRAAALQRIRAGAAASISDSPIEMLCDLATSVLPATPPDYALALQARAEAQLTPRLSVFPTMFRLHVIPFFRDYWLRRIAADGESFSDGERLSAELKVISDDASGPKTILRRAASGLRTA